MTPGEAAAIARGMVRLWPQPELDEVGIAAYATALIDAGHTADTIEAAARDLHRTRTSPWRPMPAELIEHARNHFAAARRPAPPALPAGPGSRPTTLAETLAELARLTIEARDARNRYAHRIGHNVDRLETGSMRHVSTILGIGPTQITGRDPQATELAAELLRRHDQRGAA